MPEADPPSVFAEATPDKLVGKTSKHQE